MTGKFDNVFYITGEMREFTNDKGESIPFYRGTFVQEGSGAVEMGMTREVFELLEPMHLYTLTCEVRSFQNRLRHQVIDCASA